MHSLLLYQPSLYSLAHAVATCRPSLLLIDHHPCHEKWGATNTVRQSVAVFLGSVREHRDISVAFSVWRCMLLCCCTNGSIVNIRS
jgi:hypothetical protein